MRDFSVSIISRKLFTSKSINHKTLDSIMHICTSSSYTIQVDNIRINLQITFVIHIDICYPKWTVMASTSKCVSISYHSRKGSEFKSFIPSYKISWIIIRHHSLHNNINGLPSFMYIRSSCFIVAQFSLNTKTHRHHVIQNWTHI